MGITEGEWVRVRLGFSNDVSVRSQVGNRGALKSVCRVYGTKGETEERDANVRLIVKASKMLGLLKSCKVYLEDLPYELEEVMRLCERIEKVVQEIEEGDAEV